MPGRNPLKLKFAPTIPAALGLIILLASNMLLFFGRKNPVLRSAFLEASFKYFYQHIANFSIGLMIYSMVGFIWLLMGVPFRHIAAMGIAIIFINAIYELWIPLLNTKDIIDAYYGIAGAVIGFVFLALVKKYGLKEFKG